MHLKNKHLAHKKAKRSIVEAKTTKRGGEAAADAAMLLGRRKEEASSHLGEEAPARAFFLSVVLETEPRLLLTFRKTTELGLPKTEEQASIVGEYEPSPPPSRTRPWRRKK